MIKPETKHVTIPYLFINSPTTTILNTVYDTHILDHIVKFLNEGNPKLYNHIAIEDYNSHKEMLTIVIYYHKT